MRARAVGRDECGRELDVGVVATYEGGVVEALVTPPPPKTLVTKKPCIIRYDLFVRLLILRIGEGLLNLSRRSSPRPGSEGLERRRRGGYFMLIEQGEKGGARKHWAEFGRGLVDVELDRVAGMFLSARPIAVLVVDAP